MDARTSPGSARASGDGPEAPGSRDGDGPDLGAVFAAVFAAMPGINLLLAVDPPRYTMLAASDERLAATLTTREETIGRPLFEVFSDSNPVNGEPTGVRNLRASLETVLRTRAPHRMAVQRYDLRRPDGTWEVRHWAPRNVPVLGPDGQVRYLLHHVEDVTESVRRAEAHDRLRHEYGESEDARQELEETNARLLEQQLELELANQQLQEQSADLELHAEDLRCAATALEERTAEAERARAEAGTARREAEAERARTAAILETMADAHFVLDAGFRIVSVNAAMERATGRSRDALLGRVFWEVFPGTVGTQFERHYRAAATEGKTAHFTDAYDDGRLSLVVEADAAPVAGGGVAVFWRDITARVRAEAAVRESEARFRNMADAAPVMLWVTDADGSCTFLNRAWLDFTGQTLEQGLGYGWLDAVHHEDRPRAERDFVEAHARQAPFRADYRLRRHDGTHRWVVDAAAPRLGPAGEYLGYVGSVLDVDERTQLLAAERAARVAAEEARASADALRGRAEASEALARQLFTLSPVPKWVYDAETLAFLDVNDAAVRHYGYTREEFLGMTIRDIRPPEDIPRMLAVALAPHPVGGSQGVFQHRTRAGEIIDVEVFLRDVPYGGRRAVIAVVQDVTERRRAEAALREASRAAAAARDAAESANAAKSQFLSTMSHELRTPLNAIGGYADLLTLGIRGPLTETQRQDLERIRLANQHLMALVTDILNFARLDAGQLEYRLRDVELASIVADLEPLIGPQLVAKGIAFDHDACAPDTPDQPHRVRADPEKLRQVLLNLLTNAVKFTEAGGAVAIACETDRAADVVRVRVRDTGRGIAADQLERIFEPFVQVDRHRTPESQQGVGLGLAISRDLARGMGGDLTAESTLGAGSTFTLTLPRA